MPVSLPTEYLFVPSISFRESGVGKTTNIFLFGKLRPSSLSPLPQHGYQFVASLYDPDREDSEENVQLDQTTFAGGDGATESKIAKIVKGASFIENTQNVTRFPMTVNNKADVIFCVAKTPASADAAAVTAQEKTVLADALAGTAPDDDEGYVFSQNNASRSAISNAMQTYFGADPDVAFTRTTTDETNDTLVFTAGDVGAGGDFQMILAEILPGTPNLNISFGPNFEPIIAGRGKGWGTGAIKDFNDNYTPNILEVTADNTTFDFGKGLVGLKSEGSFIVRQRDNPELVSILTNSARSYGAQYTNLMAGGNNFLGSFGLVAVHPSSKIKNQADFDVIYEAQFTGGLIRNFAKEAEPVLQVSYSGVAAQEGAPVGFSGFFRQF